MKVRNTYTVTIDCELSDTITKTMVLGFMDHEAEKENLVDIIRDSMGYPDTEKINVQVKSFHRECYYDSDKPRFVGDDGRDANGVPFW